MNINLNALDNTQQIIVNNIAVGESCTYRVLSKCGFPAFDINTTTIDVSVINFAGGDSTNVEDQLDGDTLSGKLAAPKGSFGKISYVSGNPNFADASCGKMRKMIVTVTNLGPAARVLATTTTSSFSIDFSATSGASSATLSFIIKTSFLFMATLAYLAF